MKLKTLNAHPSLFFDIRALVEKVVKLPDIHKTCIPCGEMAEEARAILEKFKKLEEK